MRDFAAERSLRRRTQPKPCWCPATIFGSNELSLSRGHPDLHQADIGLPQPYAGKVTSLRHRERRTATIDRCVGWWVSGQRV